MDNDFISSLFAGFLIALIGYMISIIPSDYLKPTDDDDREDDEYFFL